MHGRVNGQTNECFVQRPCCCLFVTLLPIKLANSHDTPNLVPFTPCALSLGSVPAPSSALGTEPWARQTASVPSLCLCHGGKDRCQATHQADEWRERGRAGWYGNVFMFGHLVPKITSMLICIFLLPTCVPSTAPEVIQLLTLSESTVRELNGAKLMLKTLRALLRQLRQRCWSCSSEDEVSPSIGCQSGHPHSGDSGLMRPSFASKKGEREKGAC